MDLQEQQRFKTFLSEVVASVQVGLVAALKYKLKFSASFNISCNLH